jgi:uncharacterized lipoprotein YmbA
MIRRAAGVAMIIALCGCGAVPTQNYYILTPQVAAPGTGEAKTATTLNVWIDPATLPEAVDRPQFVISNGDNRVTILEQQRWAESLRAAIPQVIAADLARLVDGARISAAPQTTLADDAYRLTLDVQRFESRPGDSVAVEIAWTLRRGGPVAKSGRAIAREPVAAGDYGALATAHSKALAAISREIAAALR